MRVYEAIVKGLEGLGVEAAFGGAGENATGMMLALDDSERIRGVITRNEQAAAFAANGYAMYTDKLGVCFATAGPGAFNLFSGMAAALSDSYPVLAVSGCSPIQWWGRGSLNETSGLNRTPDALKMFEATTKGSFMITRIEDTCDVLEEAVNLAYEGRPGPVHITVPNNLTERDQEVENYHDVRLRRVPVTPDPAKLAATAEFLADAFERGRRVVLLAGFGAIRSRAGDEVRRFIERFQVPLVTTLDGKGVVGEDHPLCVGVFCDSGHASAWKAFREADVVIAVGNAFNQHATFNYDESLFEDTALVHINISETEIDKAYRADHALVADARLAMAALYAALDPVVGPRQRVEVDGQDWEKRHILHLTDSLHPGEMAQAIGRMLPPGGFLLADAGAHLAWLGYYVDLEDGQHFRKAGEFGPMAGHVNGALGLQMAHPDRTVVVGCGDGCYNMSGFELMTAVEHELPIIWVIFDDREFKLIKIYQVAEYQQVGLVEFENPNYALYAQACGADGYTAETLEEFEACFAEALVSRRPSVIDARITRWAIPHYSPSPDGVIAGIVKLLEERFRS
ncbi:thiamine pyrophosphate-binding protein [Nocardioides sp. YIM 152588]|uniref:thiamine pyrophosphate-binding protein n=1 Tax=Nocardioides sp. YIM 152588 TaxID=3158259 RepID=UPI0032E47BFF